MSGVSRPIANPPDPHRLRKHTRGQGPFLRRNYPTSQLVRPCPTPARPIAICDVGVATSDRTGLPRLPALPFQRAVPITPANRTGARVDCLPVRAAFPSCGEGRRSHWHFRGLLRLHSRYSPLDRSAATTRPLARGFGPTSCPAEPLVSYRTNRQLSVWSLPPLIRRAVEAHPHVFAVRRRHRSSRAAARVHRILPPTSVTIAKRPFDRSRMRAEYMISDFRK